MKRSIILLVLIFLASVSFAQMDGTYYGGGGGGVTAEEVSKAIADTPTHQTFDLPTTALTTVAYMGGYYDFGSSADDFSPSVTFGVSDSSYDAHFMVVTGAVAADDITITITGDSVTDNTNVDTSGSETITIPKDTVAGSYFETTVNWLGTITIETTGGTPISCNYGYAAYWDNGNNDFTVVGGLANWMGDYTGETINIELIHHKSAGWTYNAGGEPDPPTPLFSMATAHGTNVEVVSNVQGRFKRAGGSFPIEGSGTEGILVRFTQSRTGCLEFGELSLRYTQ